MGTVLCGPGGDLLSRVLRQSTIGAEAFDGRVRDGIGSCRLAEGHQAGKEQFRRRMISAWRRRLRVPAAGRLSATAFFEAKLVIFSNSGTEGCPFSDSEHNQAERAISTGKLNALPRLHTRPIDVVVFHGPSGRSRFEAGFPLRCLQRLSIPYIATLHRGWRHDRSTRGTFTPVLSY